MKNYFYLQIYLPSVKLNKIDQVFLAYALNYLIGLYLTLKFIPKKTEHIISIIAANPYPF